MADVGTTDAATGKSKRNSDMANGTKAFAITALLALVAISGSQGQARVIDATSLPALGLQTE